jgi:hypothetical protein
MGGTRQSLANLRRELHGHKIRNVALDPPVINERPWYPITLTFDITGASTTFQMEVSTIIKRLISQLDLSAQTVSKICVKLNSIYGWAYQYGPATDRVDINGAVASLTPTLSDDAQSANNQVHYPFEYQFKDFGTISRPAKFGYKWSMMDSEQPLFASSNFIVGVFASNAQNSTIHLNLEWSTLDVVPPVP